MFKKFCSFPKIIKCFPKHYSEIIKTLSATFKPWKKRKTQCRLWKFWLYVKHFYNFFLIPNMYWASHCFSQNIKGEFLSFDNLFRHAQCIENRMFSDMFNCSFIFNCKSVRTQLQDPFSYALMFLPFLQKKSFSNFKKKYVNWMLLI